MALLVCNNARLECSFGNIPAPLSTIVPARTITAQGDGAADVRDCLPHVHVHVFGMCMAPKNPAVTAATAANKGTPTPAPCQPNVLTAWSPGAEKVTIKRLKALHDGCKLKCEWGGSITVQAAGQSKVSVK